MQHARRQDPYPITWEVPAGILLAFTVLVVLGLHVGRGVANLVAGGWWGFPDREHLFVSLPAFVGGDFAAGLARVEGPLAPASLMWTCVAVVETFLLIGSLAGLKFGLARWGPQRVQGLATRSEAERLLGRSRLRRHARIVRPDLYGKTGGQR
ncbi:hypothetical protein N864_05860 [Intrasporangium chromatireducens Q5-1]|uniref:Conjugal transfer protein n=1 Tax=Intrasporangium chromatireducens Q5-1 TaxID=584657 RepID=W9GGA4_9MICO|nr:hypothetical protein [Intrasporangium chromatireducens]EWT05266.1 hypothetical protein N864_05860 [Intrasporangium chromatireducens Q5-1]